MAIDREAISRPISADKPAGDRLRKLYREVTEAMSFRNAYGAVKEQEWQVVVSRCADALESKTRDFYLACCLLEGLARTEGASGLEAGLWVIAELHEKFWDTFHPVPRDRDFEGRERQLRHFTGQWEQVLGHVPMSKGSNARTWGEWNPARPGAVKMAEKKKLVSATPREFYLQTLAQLETAERHLKRLDEVVARKYPSVQRQDKEGKPIEEENGGVLTSAWSLKPQIGLLKELHTGVRQALESKPNPHKERAKQLLAQTRCGDVDLDWLTRRLESGRDVSIVTDSLRAAAVDQRNEVQIEEGWQTHLGALWDQGEAYKQRTEGKQPGVTTGGGPLIEGDLSDPLGAVLGACRTWRQVQPCNPLPYVFVREARWSALKKRQAGVPLPGPSGGVREDCRALLEAKDWDGLWERCESMLESEPVGAWLDLQRYCCWAALSVRPSRAVVKDAIVEALAGLLGRYPWLQEQKLSDDLPAADEDTRKWIESDVVKLRRQGGGATDNGPAEGELQQALQLLEEKGLTAAIDYLKKCEAEADAARTRALLQRDMGELCLAAKRPDYAVPILEGLRRELDERNLAAWEGKEFMGRTLEALYRSYRESARRRPADWDAKMKSVGDELAHVDLGRWIRLESAR